MPYNSVINLSASVVRYVGQLTSRKIAKIACTTLFDDLKINTQTITSIKMSQQTLMRSKLHLEYYKIPFEACSHRKLAIDFQTISKGGESFCGYIQTRLRCNCEIALERRKSNQSNQLNYCVILYLRLSYIDGQFRFTLISCYIMLTYALMTNPLHTGWPLPFCTTTITALMLVLQKLNQISRSQLVYVHRSWQCTDRPNL